MALFRTFGLIRGHTGEWGFGARECGGVRREHVRGRITVLRGDASGLFSPYAQFDRWIDRYGPRPLYAGLRILCAEHRHTAIDVGCVSRDRDCRGGWFGARAWAAGFLWRH